jgi:hypothetical protein
MEGHQWTEGSLDPAEIGVCPEIVDFDRTREAKGAERNVHGQARPSILVGLGADHGKQTDPARANAARAGRSLPKGSEVRIASASVDAFAATHKPGDGKAAGQWPLPARTSVEVARIAGHPEMQGRRCAEGGSRFLRAAPSRGFA